MSESTRGTRIRVNVATTSKGIPSWDATIEIWDGEADTETIRQRVLEESDKLHAALKARYGVQQEGK